MISLANKRKEFFLRYKDIIPEFDLFLERLSFFPENCFRRNGLKIKYDNFLKIFEPYIKEELLEIESNKFNPLDIFQYRDKNNFQLAGSIEHSLGLFYIQAASSMLAVHELDPRPHQMVLDICAAPGGKTTMIADKMQNTGLIVANEPNHNRNKVLKAQIAKFGVMNTMVTTYWGEKLPNKYMFDKILVDGPCSAEGTLLGEHHAVMSWEKDDEFRHKLNINQFMILNKAFKQLKVGGELVYSTCTYDPLENEHILTKLIEKNENAKLLPTQEIDGLCNGITEYHNLKFHPDVVMAKRVYPHKFNSWGFFYAKLTKH